MAAPHQGRGEVIVTNDQSVSLAAMSMKALTFAIIVALIWHVWVGMREIWMDYVKPVWLRLSLQVFTIVWLAGCAGWAIQVLWRL